MEVKTCSTCKRELGVERFSKHKSHKDGLQSQCKDCVAEYNAKPENKKRMVEYRAKPENKKRKVEYRAEYNAKPENKKRKAESDAKYRANPEVKKRIAKRMAEWWAEYWARPEVKKRKAEYWAKPEVKKRVAEYWAKPENKKRKAEYWARPEVKKRKAEWEKERCLTDINFKLAKNLRSRLYDAIKGNFKSGSAVRDLGCTVDELKIYLAKQFKEGMTWDNWSLEVWHVDHIIPLSVFNLEDRNQLLQAVHYSNLQPMWAHDNLVKHDKILECYCL